MKYSKEELMAALMRLAPNSHGMLMASTMPEACEKVAAKLFVTMDDLPDTDIRVSKDITMLRKALNDLWRNGFFNYQ